MSRRANARDDAASCRRRRRQRPQGGLGQRRRKLTTFSIMDETNSSDLLTALRLRVLLTCYWSPRIILVKNKMKPVGLHQLNLVRCAFWYFIKSKPVVLPVHDPTQFSQRLDSVLITRITTIKNPKEKICFF